MTQAARSRTRRAVPHPGPVAPAAPAALPPAPPAALPMAPEQGTLDLPEANAAAWRREKEKYDALLRRVEYERTAGALLPLAAWEAAAAEIGAIARARLEGAGALMAPELVGKDEAHIRAAIDAHMHELLREIAAQFARHGERAAEGGK